MYRLRPPFLFLAAVICLLSLGAAATAQANHEVLRYKSMSFFRISIKEGLSQVSGNSILQDRTGYIWIGTQDGLNRYDGHDVRVFRHDREDPQSLGRDFVNVLAEDARGHLWIGTRGNGLDEYDPLLDRFHHYLQTKKGDGKSAADIRALEIVKDRVLIGTLQGLFALDLNTRQIRPIPLTDTASGAPTIHDLLSLPDGRILVASSSGLHQLDLETGKSRPALAPIMKSYPGGVRSVFLDSQHRLWVATHDQGVLLIDTITETLVRHFRHEIGNPDALTFLSANTFAEDAQKNIWIGTEGGLNLYLDHSSSLIRIADSRLRPEGLADHTIRSLYTDPNGTLWLGTHVGGINHVTPHLVRFGKENPSRYMKSLDRRILGMAITPDGDMFIGTEEGLVRRRAGEADFEPVPVADQPAAATRSAVYGVYAARDGTVWTGSATGLRRLAPGEETLGPTEVDSPYFFVSILEDEDGFLWLGRPRELLKYDPVNRKIVAHLNIPHVYGLLLLDSGKLLVGGLGAIHVVDTASARILSSLEGSTHGFNTITYLFRSSQGDIWAGTQGDGLFHLELPPDLNLPGSKLTFFTTREGLLSNAIGAIQESRDGNLWISTINSISRLDPRTGDIRNFDARDGAFSEGYFIGSGTRDKEGTIYFGGTVGLTFFSPEWITSDPSRPRIIFTELRLDNQTVEAGGEDSPLKYPLAYSRRLVIAPKWSSISLSFSSDNFASPSSQRYAYRMLGAEETWTETDADNRFASYTNLAPGNYRFQVKATNLDGQWSDRPGEISITVLPTWYQTPWAWLLFLLAFGSALYIFVRWRMAGLVRRNIELEKRVSERTQALTDANRKLSHLARTDALTGLLNRRAFTELFPGNDVSRQNRGSGSLALLDIDLFKQFNDQYGHDCGDAVLRELARLLRENLRQKDVVARWGGEEFIILLPDTDLESAAEIMERLRQSVAFHEFRWKERTLRITITAGLGKCVGTNLDASLQPVDRALFLGKEKGRNRLVIAPA